MLKTYRGMLVPYSNGEEDDLLALFGDDLRIDGPLADEIKDDIDAHGEYLTVRYWVSDAKLSRDELMLEFMKELYGEGDARYALHYSDLTGYLWTDEDLNVGGHDLLAELKTYLGKYLHMEIKYSRTMSREYTTDEVRTKFLEHVWQYIEYWDKLPHKTTTERMEGVAFSILAMLDGSSIDIPGFIVAPSPHPKDRAYLQSMNANWWPENNEAVVNADIGGSLHELFHKAKPQS